MSWEKIPQGLQSATSLTGPSYFQFPWWCSGREPVCQCRSCKRCRFYPWVRKIPRSRKQQLIPVFLPGKSHRKRSQVGYSPGALKRVRRNLAANNNKIPTFKDEGMPPSAQKRSKQQFMFHKITKISYLFMSQPSTLLLWFIDH